MQKIQIDTDWTQEHVHGMSEDIQVECPCVPDRKAQIMSDYIPETSRNYVKLACHVGIAGSNYFLLGLFENEAWPDESHYIQEEIWKILRDFKSIKWGSTCYTHMQCTQRILSLSTHCLMLCISTHHSTIRKTSCQKIGHEPRENTSCLSASFWASINWSWAITSPQHASATKAMGPITTAARVKIRMVTKSKARISAAKMGYSGMPRRTCTKMQMNFWEQKTWSKTSAPDLPLTSIWSSKKLGPPKRAALFCELPYSLKLPTTSQLFCFLRFPEKHGSWLLEPWVGDLRWDPMQQGTMKKELIDFLAAPTCARDQNILSVEQRMTGINTLAQSVQSLISPATLNISNSTRSFGPKDLPS